jgi:hypothetical protein
MRRLVISRSAREALRQRHDPPLRVVRFGGRFGGKDNDDGSVPERDVPMEEVAHVPSHHCRRSSTCASARGRRLTLLRMATMQLAARGARSISIVARGRGEVAQGRGAAACRGANRLLGADLRGRAAAGGAGAVGLRSVVSTSHRHTAAHRQRLTPRASSDGVSAPATYEYVAIPLPVMGQLCWG